MLKTKHRLHIRNRRLLRNKKSIKRNELIKVSRSNQEEWSKGVTQWFTRRQIKRINHKYRLQIASYRQSSEEEWKEGFGEWSDQKILRKANRWLNRMRASGRIIPRKSVQRISSKTRRKISTNLYQKQAYQKNEIKSNSQELKNEKKNTEDDSNGIGDDCYYLYKDEKQHGPHSFSEIQDLASNGDISPKDLTFFKGCNDWVEASNISGIRFRITDKSEIGTQEKSEIPAQTSNISNNDKRIKTSSEIRASNDDKRILSPRFSILSLIFVIIIVTGITFIIFDRIQSLENELSSRIDEWDQELAFLKDSPENVPTEANSTNQSKVAIQLEDLGVTPNSIPQTNATKHVFEIVINPDLDKLRQLSSTLSTSIKDISVELKNSNDASNERNALVRLLQEFDQQTKLVSETSSTNEIILKQNIRAFAQTLIFFKELSNKILIDKELSKLDLQEISDQLAPVKQSFQTQAVKMFDSTFKDYPTGKHVRIWTDQGGNKIKAFLWGYRIEDDLMVLVKNPSNEPTIIKIKSSELGLSQLDRVYLNSFKAWKKTLLDFFLLNPPEMVLIKAGKFHMGSFAFEEGRNDDETRHEVTLTSDFLMGKYEVTVGEWVALMGNHYKSNGSNIFYGYKSPFNDSWTTNNKIVGTPLIRYLKLPVSSILIEDVEEYCRRLTEREERKGRLPKGKIYRLPTEAEWEYALRSGSESAYFWGDKAEGVIDYASLFGNTQNKTVLVGSKKPNNWGIHDMVGSVGELLADRPRVFTKDPVVDPVGEIIENIRPTKYSSHYKKAMKVGFQRGFGTNSNHFKFRSAFRVCNLFKTNSLTSGSGGVGFRIVLASPLKF